jgi:hypothetical protein
VDSAEYSGNVGLLDDQRDDASLPVAMFGVM